MTGQTTTRPRVIRTDDPPPRPGAPARRRPSIRDLVDRELRNALITSVADLPRRPSDGFHDLARGVTRPAGKMPDRLIEAAAHGARRDRVKASLREAMERAVDLAFDAVERAAA